MILRGVLSLWQPLLVANGEFNHRKERKTMLMDNIDLWCAKYKD